jgi:hypothetical protein
MLCHSVIKITLFGRVSLNEISIIFCAILLLNIWFHKSLHTLTHQNFTVLTKNWTSNGLQLKTKVCAQLTTEGQEGNRTNNIGKWKVHQQVRSNEVLRVVLNFHFSWFFSDCE